MAESETFKERQIPKISLHDFESRRDEIGKQIVSAAENPGFFVLVNQASPSVKETEEMFELSYLSLS
jgi:isopenicillin N synthase-like dioxygenase